jgi:hypothetical protein
MIYENNKKRLLGNDINDISKKQYRNIMRLKYGLTAEIIIKVAELTYDIFLENKLGLTSIFLSLLSIEKTKYDIEIGEEYKKMLNRQELYLSKKKNLSKLQPIATGMGMGMGMLGLHNLPVTPPQYMGIIAMRLQQYGIHTSVVPSVSGFPAVSGFPSLSGFSTGSSNSLRSVGKINLPVELRTKIEGQKFWQELRTIFNGKTILLPIAKLKQNRVFDDDEFYLLDVFRSMIFNKLSILKVSKGGKLNYKVIDKYICK